MKIEVLFCLLFVAVASALAEESNDPVNEDNGMCPSDFYKKYPESFKGFRTKSGKRRRFPDFSKMPDCGTDGSCVGDLKCCRSPCGMKCMKPMYDKDAQNPDTGFLSEESNEEHDITEDDIRLGMCPHKYMITHPEVEKKMHQMFKKKKGFPKHKDCKDGNKCTHHHKFDREPKMGFPNFTKMADCVEDRDCGENMRCCKSPCGMKCMKPVFTDEEFFSLFETNKNERRKREVDESNGHESEKEQQGEGEKQGLGHAKGRENGKGCGKGKGKEKGAENGKGNGEGAEHGKGHGKGVEHGKGHGKGAEHGKGHGNGVDHGKGHGKGAEHGKGHGMGVEHGKGHGKGLEHGKGHGQASQNGDNQVEEGNVQVRQKRFSSNGLVPEGVGGVGMDFGQGQGGGQEPGQGKGKGGCKGKGKKNKKAKGNGQCGGQMQEQEYYMA